MLNDDGAWIASSTSSRTSCSGSAGPRSKRSAESRPWMMSRMMFDSVIADLRAAGPSGKDEQLDELDRRSQSVTEDYPEEAVPPQGPQDAFGLCGREARQRGGREVHAAQQRSDDQELSEPHLEPRELLVYRRDQPHPEPDGDAPRRHGSGGEPARMPCRAELHQGESAHQLQRH